MLIDIRGIGGSTPQGRGFPSTKGAKIGKKGGFRGVENLENFEKKMKKGGFCSAENLKNFEKNGKRGVLGGAEIFENFEKL